VRIFGVGLIVWAVPLIARHALYFLQLYSEQAFLPAVMLAGLAATAAGLVFYLPHARGILASEGWVVGACWLPLCIGLDCAYYFALQGREFDAVAYFTNEAWLYLYIPITAIAAGYLGHVIDVHLPDVSTPRSFPLR
jgi:hypothetical protein